MQAIENLDDLLGAVAVWENRDLFYKVMQTSSSWLRFGARFQFIEDTSTLFASAHWFYKHMCGHEGADCCVSHIEHQLIKQSTVKSPTQIIFLLYLTTSVLS